MIVIPAIAAGLAAIVEPILIGIGLGALVSGGIAGVGTAVSGVQEHGTFNGEVASVALQSAAEGAAEGALVGGAFGAVSVVAAPIVPVVLRPVAGVVDDVARPVVDVVQRAAKPVINAVDDIAGKVLARFRPAPNAGSLYVMDDAANAVSKIGITKRPPQLRIAEVQRQVGSKLNYAGIQPVDDMRAAERAWHQHFASQNIRHPNHLQGREWFNLSELDKASIFAR